MTTLAASEQAQQLSASSASPTVQGEVQASEAWNVEDSRKLYSVRRWGQGYFDINASGNVTVHPDQDPLRSIDLKALVDELRQRDIQLPLLLRFTDILKHRVGHIHKAFARAIEENTYNGKYRCVYPIKVNQQRHVVEEIIEFGSQYGFGVEAGSKPELLAVMAMVKDDATPIICNGFKDDEYIEAVILAAKIGKNIIPVVEKFSELELIARYAKIHNVRPTIGVRVKLAAPGSGRWEQSGGDRSKFGLFVSEVLDALKYLRANQMEDCLKLLHFHLGSQINNIRNIKGAVTELARVFVEMIRCGATGLKYIDIGGGLGVDYDGSNTTDESSMNYTIQEYANNVIFHIKEICDQFEVPHPDIVSESGRAMVAYHSVLVFNVLDWSGFKRFDVPETPTAAERKKLPQPVRNLFDCYRDITGQNMFEYYHDAQLARDETLNMFKLGFCSLEHRSLAERLYYGVCTKILKHIDTLAEVPDEFANLAASMSDTYFCNYSVFQSMPDSWAINQLFPIMPIHRLAEEPNCRGILADITCDSDGKVDAFIDHKACKRALELHPFKPGEDYLLAAFLVGAYQEILGDLHNLFGDTNAVHVSLDGNGRASVDEVVEGDTVREVLHYVEISADELKRAMRRRVEVALRDGKLTVDESRLLLKFYERGLEGYTYLE